MRLIICLITILNSALVFGQDAEFLFSERTIKLPKIHEGDSISTTFHFTNVGSDTLFIESLESCHCTKTTHPAMVPPGGKGEIHATFYSEGRRGKNESVIDIWYGEPLPYKVRFLIKVKRRKKKC